MRPAAAALFLFALLSVACAVPKSPAPAPQAQQQPKPGGTLTLPLISDPGNWDLTQGGLTAPNPNVMTQATSNLLNFRAAPDVPYGQGVTEPGLAESWEVNKDATVYTYHLRNGVKFADLPPVNGREFTSKDVKFTFEYYARIGEFKGFSPASPVAWTYEGIQSVETPDPHTAVVRFSEPRASFLGVTAADRWSAIVPREIFDQDKHLKDRLIGTGPYTFDQIASQKGTRWVFKKNASYFIPGQPYIDQVRWLVLPDDAATYAAFQDRKSTRLNSSHRL